MPRSASPLMQTMPARPAPKRYAPVSLSPHPFSNPEPNSGVVRLN